MVNAAIGSYPHSFKMWDELASRPVEELMLEGAPILRANQAEIERLLRRGAPLAVGNRRVESVNATSNRSRLGHELAKRAEREAHEHGTWRRLQTRFVRSGLCMDGSSGERGRKRGARRSAAQPTRRVGAKRKHDEAARITGTIGPRSPRRQCNARAGRKRVPDCTHLRALSKTTRSFP